ncbi:receptor/non-receptor type protein-tyrosine phosphatase, partial [Coemansia reversa NRRL 1564]
MVSDDNQYTISAGLELGEKNRYTSIYPFDSNRVRLRTPGAAKNDYVNASYISYFDGPLYIATQGPLPTTVVDFWRMVWEEHTRVIVMLTTEFENGRPKCHRYWPPHEGEAAMYGDLCVEFQAEALHPDDSSVIARRLRLTRPAVSDAIVSITHLQYVGWVDHCVPENPLGVLRLRQLARQAQAEGELAAAAEEGADIISIPMVVHCSAGCGRTGAFCVIDTILDIDERQRNGSIFMVVSRFRELRITMVQTIKQFVFCHDAL